MYRFSFFAGSVRKRGCLRAATYTVHHKGKISNSYRKNRQYQTVMVLADCGQSGSTWRMPSHAA